MWNLWAKPDLCEADVTPGLPFLRLMGCGEAPGRCLEVLDSYPALFPPLPLLRPCCQCPFPFWNGHTTDVVLKTALDD